MFLCSCFSSTGINFWHLQSYKTGWLNEVMICKYDSFHMEPLVKMSQKPRKHIHGCCCFSRSVLSDSLATPRTVAHQSPLSVEFSRQEYCSGLPFPSPGDLPDPGIKPASPALAGRFFTTEPPGKPYPWSLGWASILDVLYLECFIFLYPLSCFPLDAKMLKIDLQHKGSPDIWKKNGQNP